VQATLDPIEVKPDQAASIADLLIFNETLNLIQTLRLLKSSKLQLDYLEAIYHDALMLKVPALSEVMDKIETMKEVSKYSATLTGVYLKKLNK